MRFPSSSRAFAFADWVGVGRWFLDLIRERLPHRDVDARQFVLLRASLLPPAWTRFGVWAACSRFFRLCFRLVLTLDDQFREDQSNQVNAPPAPRASLSSSSIRSCKTAGSSRTTACRSRPAGLGSNSASALAMPLPSVDEHVAR